VQLPESGRQQVEEDSLSRRRGNREQRPALIGREAVVDRLEVRRLPGQGRAVVDDLGDDFSCERVEMRHGEKTFSRFRASTGVTRCTKVRVP